MCLPRVREVPLNVEMSEPGSPGGRVGEAFVVDLSTMTVSLGSSEMISVVKS